MLLYEGEREGGPGRVSVHTLGLPPKHDRRAHSIQQLRRQARACDYIRVTSISAIDCKNKEFDTHG